MNDQRVAAPINIELPPRTQVLLERALHVLRRHIAHVDHARDQILGFDLGFLGLGLFVLLARDIGERVDPDDIAFANHAQVVHLEQHV